MSTITLFSSAAVGVALVCAVLAVFAMPKGAAGPPAWSASSLGAMGLAGAALSGSTRSLDLAAVAGVVLVGGVAGAGWTPRGRGVLLAFGLLGLTAALFARLQAVSQVLGGPGVADQLTWAVARASGFAAFFAATGAVLLGARRPCSLPVGGLPARVYALHRALGITSVLALALHLTFLWLDSYVEFSWEQLLLAPWTSGYRPLALTLGWLAAILLLLTAASGGLGRLVPGWRVVHALAYLTFALGLVHGLVAGSDAGAPWALSFYAVALLAVGWALTRRFKRPRSVRPRNQKGTAKEAPGPEGTGHVPPVGSHSRTRV